MAAKRGRYPQVAPQAADLATPRIAVVPPALPIAEAARVAHRRRTALLLAPLGRGWGGATPATLEHALALGLARVPLSTVLWEAPALPAQTPEVAVRRRLGPGAPFAVVLAHGRPLGVVVADRAAARPLPLDAGAALARLGAEQGRLLRAAGTIGRDLGWPVAAVGGVVRDLLRGDVPVAADLDLAVEGQASVVADRLAQALGGAVTHHPAFSTASVAWPDGRRVDVVTARRERYPRPGALPQVEQGTLADDLARRDFSVNALALRLDGAAWGTVLDPLGGLRDLRARRLRVLHPLSFVEDPTRIFRAGRFAVRLGFVLERATRRLLAAAAPLPLYAALSGDRVRAELQQILEEPAPAEVLVRLGRLGALRLCDPGYRFTAPTAARLRAAARNAARHSLARESTLALVLLALTDDLRSPAAAAWTARLDPPPALWALLTRARADVPALIAALDRARDAREAARRLRGVPEGVAAWALTLARGRRARVHLTTHLAVWRHLTPLLTGDDLVALGRAPGPEFGQVLGALVAEQAAGRIRTREEALAWVRSAP